MEHVFAIKPTNTITSWHPVSVRSNLGHARIQPQLAINTPGDTYEQEADRVADQIMRMEGSKMPMGASSPPRVQRSCAACSDSSGTCSTCEKKKQEIQRQETSAAPPTSVPPIVRQVLNSPGRPLDSSARKFFEPRFGQDFSQVRIHTEGLAAESARTINAKAYTLGQNIVFGQGTYLPDREAGRHLVAHELTHVVQQGSGQSNIQRSLNVERPQSPIPGAATGPGATTNAHLANQYLQRLCATGGITVNGAGNISIPSSFCNVPVPLSSGQAGPPAPSQAFISSTPTGCKCVCDIIHSSNSWRILIDDSTWPHTVPDNHLNGSKVGSGGTGGVVTAPSPNDAEAWGAVTATGNFRDIDPWLILGHELCGHAWMMDQGAHGQDSVSSRGRGGHQATVERENSIRDEHGIERRGTHRQPYCGESFSHSKGTAPAAGSVTMSGSLRICELWRQEYNRLNGTTFTIADTIPVQTGERLPP